MEIAGARGGKALPGRAATCVFVPPLIVSFFVIAAMVALSAWAWTVLPPDARIATHWGLNEHPNGDMPKTIGLILAPALAFVLSLFFAALPGIEPRRANLLASRKLYLAGWYGTLAILAFTHLFVVRNAMGLPTAGPYAIFIVTALFLIVIGNFLGKSHSNFFVGVRLPCGHVVERSRQWGEEQPHCRLWRSWQRPAWRHRWPQLLSRYHIAAVSDL